VPQLARQWDQEDCKYDETNNASEGWLVDAWNKKTTNQFGRLGHPPLGRTPRILPPSVR
jgi:hypothetical protein